MDRVYSNRADRQHASTSWVSKIKDYWQEATQNIFKIGRLLIEAKAQLRHGEWSRMVDNELPFGLATAEAHMRIARNPVLSKSEFVQKLPPSWGTLFEMTKLPEEALASLLADGTIHCESQRRDIVELRAAIQAEGVYLYHRVRDANSTLIKFARRWPDPVAIANRIFDLFHEEGQEIDLNILLENADWLVKLHEVCRALDRDENTTLRVELRPTTVAEIEQAELCRKRTPKVKRRNGFFSRRPGSSGREFEPESRQ